jgi:hypothetical protein
MNDVLQEHRGNYILYLWIKVKLFISSVETTTFGGGNIRVIKMVLLVEIK